MNLVWCGKRGTGVTLPYSLSHIVARLPHGRYTHSHEEQWKQTQIHISSSPLNAYYYLHMYNANPVSDAYFLIFENSRPIPATVAGTCEGTHVNDKSGNGSCIRTSQDMREWSRNTTKKRPQVARLTKLSVPRGSAWAQYTTVHPLSVGTIFMASMTICRDTRNGQS